MLKEKAGGQCDWSQVSAGTGDWELGSERNHVGGSMEGRLCGASKGVGFHCR